MLYTQTPQENEGKRKKERGEKSKSPIKTFYGDFYFFPRIRKAGPIILEL